VNFITISRFFGAAALLVLWYLAGSESPLTAVFYIIYVGCVTSDIVDGWLARKMKVTSNFGAALDSAADLTLIVVMLFILIPYVDFRLWMLLLIALVLAIRAVALAIGYAKYRTFTLLHTYSNKWSGLALAAFPLIFGFVNLSVAFSVVFAAACFAALEELLITIRSKELDRNITSWLKV